VITSGELSSPIQTNAPAQKLAAIAASGAITGSVRGVRFNGSAIAPTISPTRAAAAASRQPPPRIGVSAAATSA